MTDMKNVNYQFDENILIVANHLFLFIFKRNKNFNQSILNFF
jgi:hypothetical protein